MTEPSMDPELEGQLQALYRFELKRATNDLRAAPIMRRTRVVARPGVLAAGFSFVAIVAALLVAVALRPIVGTNSIPATIDGQPVLTGWAIADTIANSTDDTPFLIGGWFPAGGNYTYCLAITPGPASCAPYLLHLSKGSEESLFVYPDTAASDIVSYMATQPVVMRVHTHDARCQALPNLDHCDNRLVLEEIVWLGPKS